MTIKISAWLPFAFAVAFAGIACAREPVPAHPRDADPNLWLEDIDGVKPLAWVMKYKADTVKKYAQTPAFNQLLATLK